MALRAVCSGRQRSESPASSSNSSASSASLGPFAVVYQQGRQGVAVVEAFGGERDRLTGQGFGLIQVLISLEVEPCQVVVTTSFVGAAFNTLAVGLDGPRKVASC